MARKTPQGATSSARSATGRTRGTCPNPRRRPPRALRGRRPGTTAAPGWPQTRHAGPRGSPQGTTTQNRLSMALDAISEGAGRVVRGHGVSLARRGLVQSVGPCDARLMRTKDRPRVQPCVWGVGYAGAAAGLNGLTMGRRGKTTHAALDRAAARSRGGLNDPTPRAEKGRSA